MTCSTASGITCPGQGLPVVNRHNATKSSPPFRLPLRQEHAELAVLQEQEEQREEEQEQPEALS